MEKKAKFSADNWLDFTNHSCYSASASALCHFHAESMLLNQIKMNQSQRFVCASGCAFVCVCIPWDINSLISSSEKSISITVSIKGEIPNCIEFSLLSLRFILSSWLWSCCTLSFSCLSWLSLSISSLTMLDWDNWFPEVFSSLSLSQFGLLWSVELVFCSSELIMPKHYCKATFSLG